MKEIYKEFVLALRKLKKEGYISLVSRLEELFENDAIVVRKPFEHTIKCEKIYSAYKQPSLRKVIIYNHIQGLFRKVIEEDKKFFYTLYGISSYNTYSLSVIEYYITEYFDVITIKHTRKNIYIYLGVN